MKALVLGATGLLGNAVFRTLHEGNPQTIGTVRSDGDVELFEPALRASLVTVSDLTDICSLENILHTQRPDVVINCVAAGRTQWDDCKTMIELFAVLPRRVGFICARRGIRFVHMSSDGVFSGARGKYTEDDLPDATDLYGISKQLGEPTDSKSTTLRTSIIGHGLRGTNGLVDWFLSQRGPCKGFARAIFTGFPTTVLARLIRDVILPRPQLNGLFHLATPPISKLDLLRLIAERYGRTTEIVPDDGFALDRSLVATKFRDATGYMSPSWLQLIDQMYVDRQSGGYVH